MGSCVGICNLKMIKSNGDIIIEKSSENETGKYLETQYMKKVIYLQKNVKEYLKNKNSLNNKNITTINNKKITPQVIRK